MTTPATPPTPPTPPTQGSTQTPAAAIAQVKSDVTADVAAVNTAVKSAEGAARAEYEALAPEVQAAIHKALNDVETAFGVSLAAVHTLYGAK